MDKDDNIFYCQQMREQIDIIKKQQEIKSDDKLIHFFTKTPRWFVRFVASFLRWADFPGFLPKTITDTIPFYSSVFCLI